MTGVAQLLGCSRLTMGTPFLEQMASYGATDAWDFVNNVYLRNKNIAPSGITFTRASAGYAETTTGTLTEFGSGVARITNQGMLIEGSRENIFLRSQEFQTTWTTNALSVTSNTETAPDGTQTADTITADGTSAAHNVSQSVTVTAAQHAFSVYAKAGTLRYIQLRFSAAIAGQATNFDLVDGVKTDVSGAAPTESTITALGNGWYRCTIRTGLTAATGFCGVFCVTGLSASNGQSNTLSGTIHLWNGQLELGVFPSSPIKTEGSKVTRAADSAYVTPSGYTWPVSIYAEIAGAMNTLTFPRLVQWEAGTGSRIELVNADPTLSTDRTYMYSGIGGGANAAVVSGLSAGVKRTATKIESGAIRLSVNGGAVQSGTATGTTATGDFYFGNRTALDRPLFDYIRRLAIFPRALTDAQLQAITT